MLRLLPLAALLLLSGCGVLGFQQQASLVSGHSPPDAGAAGNQMPQSTNSLPVDAAGVGQRSPTAQQPSYAQYTFGTR